MTKNSSRDRRAVRRAEAEDRKATRGIRTDQEQLDLISERTDGRGAGKEVDRLIINTTV